jgi:phosphoribosylaminoimidazole carboxylase (NCAIR synthetase)
MSSSFEAYKTALNKYFTNKNLFYFVRDPERSLGLEKILNNYHVIHVLNSQYKKYFESIGLKYLCLDDSEKNSNDSSTRKIFNSSAFINYFQKYQTQENFAQTFKTNPAYEKALAKNNFVSLNSTAQVSRLIEDKITQFQLLSKLVKFPKTYIAKLTETNYLELTRDLGESFVVQFQRGHTGSGTFTINSEKEFKSVVDSKGNLYC